MSSIDPLENLRKAVNEAMSSATGNRTPITVQASDVSILLATLREQEADLRRMEDAIVSADHKYISSQASIELLKEALAFQNFDEIMPPETAENEPDALYEVFIGPDVETGGRIFAFWDPENESFYRFMEYTDGEEEIEYLDDVLYWRSTLADPGFEVDLNALILEASVEPAEDAAA